MQVDWVPSQFLKHGPYLGALGCVINSFDQFLKPPSQVAAEKKAAQGAAAKNNKSSEEAKESSTESKAPAPEVTAEEEESPKVDVGKGVEDKPVEEKKEEPDVWTHM